MRWGWAAGWFSDVRYEPSSAPLDSSSAWASTAALGGGADDGTVLVKPLFTVSRDYRRYVFLHTVTLRAEFRNPSSSSGSSSSSSSSNGAVD